MTEQRAPSRLPDAPWLLAGTAVVVAIALVVIAFVGSNDQRFARERVADPTRPVPVLANRKAVPAPAFSQRVPPEVVAARGEWPLPNHDYGNTRATTTAKIDSSNVSRLGVAWTRDLRGAGLWGSAASGPLIASGVVYFQDLTSDVFAFDLRTGARRWVSSLDQAAFGPNGPALGYGKLYAQDGNNHLAALDLQSGRVAWRAALAGPTGQQQPTVYDGMVYTGIAAARRVRGSSKEVKTRLVAPGSSGFAYGIEVKHGGVVWEFQTVTKGFWGDPKLNGGGGIWMTPAIDTATGTTFWSTGNPVPAPGTRDFPNAVTRPGPNLYSNTLLALDGRSGKIRWYNQVLPHDLFHHDFQDPPVLVEGGGKKLVIGSGKMGVLYGIDRETGELLWKTPLGKHLNDDLQKLPLGKVVTVYPGFWGGVETPFALADKTVYALTNNLPTPYTATAWGAKDGTEAVHNLEGRTSYKRGTSELVAVDAIHGRVKWSHQFPQVGFGAATVVNDLVFTATYDGMIYALARSDGHVVWKYQAPGGIVAWPAVAGDMVVWPIGLGRQPVLVAFRLGAKVPTVLPRARPAAKESG